jgi:ribosomal-protein-alanine N-acetyltransferase
MAQVDREFPALTTERLRLREPRMDDAAAIAAVLAIPEVTRYSNLPDAPKMAVEVGRI